MPEPHKVTLVLTRDGARIELICPEGGCAAADDALPGFEECWIKEWFENALPEETYDGPELDLAGRILPAPIECCGDDDGLHWRVAEEASP
jgi:hypothetical protein